MILRAAAHGLRRAVAGLLRRPVATGLAVGSIGVSLLLVGVLVLSAKNVSRWAASWGRGVQMVVYLDDGVTGERAQEIARALGQARGVVEVEYVPASEASRRLADSLGERKELLGGVEESFFPASLEVSLASGVRSVAGVSPLVERLRATQGVEEVEFLGDWVDRLAKLLASLRAAAAALAVLVAGACLYVIGATIQLSLAARREEIEILKLVGATPRFVRMPLLVEGALQGAFGSALAAGLLYLLFRSAGPTVEGMLSGVLGGLEVSFLAARELAFLVGTGMLLGVVGSWLAVGRHADA